MSGRLWGAGLPDLSRGGADANYLLPNPSFLMLVCCPYGKQIELWIEKRIYQCFLKRGGEKMRKLWLLGAFLLGGCLSPTMYSNPFTGALTSRAAHEMTNSVFGDPRTAYQHRGTSRCYEENGERVCTSVHRTERTRETLVPPLTPAAEERVVPPGDVPACLREGRCVDRKGGL